MTQGKNIEHMKALVQKGIESKTPAEIYHSPIVSGN